MDNQNTFMAVMAVVLPAVLILVLMDNQNTSINVENDILELVLILVLMDNQNTMNRKIRHLMNRS